LRRARAVKGGWPPATGLALTWRYFPATGQLVSSLVLFDNTAKLKIKASQFHPYPPQKTEENTEDSVPFLLSPTQRATNQ